MYRRSKPRACKKTARDDIVYIGKQRKCKFLIECKICTCVLGVSSNCFAYKIFNSGINRRILENNKTTNTRPD